MNLKEIDFTKFKENATKLLVKLGHVSIIVIALGVGYGANEIMHAYKEGKRGTDMQKVHPLSTTSVAINERNELVIFDRANGSYKIYDDSVGTTIFDIYAARIYYNKTMKQ